MESAGWQFNPPPEVLPSSIFAAGGYVVVRGLFDEETLAALDEEAQAAREGAERMVLERADETEGRGGFPARSYVSGAAGQLHWGLHGCRQMAETLAGVCGFDLAATGSGTYSYYEEPGDFLGLHRDVLQCDVAVITALTRCQPGRDAGELVIYPELQREPLSAVRAAGRGAGLPVVLDRGHTIILLGGIVPHEVAATDPGQQRIVAINCYRVLPANKTVEDG